MAIIEPIHVYMYPCLHVPFNSLNFQTNFYLPNVILLYLISGNRWRLKYPDKQKRQSNLN